jgi:hypothetical protein
VLADGRAVDVGCVGSNSPSASVESKGIAGERRVGAGEGELLAFPDDLVRASGIPVDDTVGVCTVANVEVNAPGNRAA